MIINFPLITETTILKNHRAFIWYNSWNSINLRYWVLENFHKQILLFYYLTRFYPNLRENKNNRKLSVFNWKTVFLAQKIFYSKKVNQTSFREFQGSFIARSLKKILSRFWATVDINFVSRGITPWLPLGSIRN